MSNFGRWFPAGFDSDCDGCGDLIIEGDRFAATERVAGCAPAAGKRRPTT